MDLPCFIERMPNELLLCIFEWLPGRHGSNLLPATLVCSRWNSLICSSRILMGKIVLRIDRSSCGEDLLLEKYDSFLSRSVRHYPAIRMAIYDQQSLAVAVLVLRKFGPHLRELILKLSNTDDTDYLSMPCSLMKELELGLEKHDRMMWEQEVDSCDRSPLPIAVYNFTPFLYEQLHSRQIEEVFLVFVYRTCFRMENLWIQHEKDLYDVVTRFSLYEGSEMKHLKELRIDGSGHLVLANKSTSLRELHLNRVNAELSYFASFGHMFPLLTHLTITVVEKFDDSCLWAISRQCSQLKDLYLRSDNVTRQGFRHLHHLQQLKWLDVDLKIADFKCKAVSVEYLTIKSQEMDLETIQHMLDINVNLKVVNLYTIKFTDVLNMDYRQLRVRPTCKLTCTQYPDLCFY